MYTCTLCVCDSLPVYLAITHFQNTCSLILQCYLKWKRSWLTVLFKGFSSFFFSVQENKNRSVLCLAPSLRHLLCQPCYALVQPESLFLCCLPVLSACNSPSSSGTGPRMATVNCESLISSAQQFSVALKSLQSKKKNTIYLSLQSIIFHYECTIFY